MRILHESKLNIKYFHIYIFVEILTSDNTQIFKQSLYLMFFNFYDGVHTENISLFYMTSVADYLN